MDQKFIEQALAEIIESQSAANAILILALAKQLNHAQLRNDIQAILTGWKESGDPMPSLTDRLLSRALVALPGQLAH